MNHLLIPNREMGGSSFQPNMHYLLLINHGRWRLLPATSQNDSHLGFSTPPLLSRESYTYMFYVA